MPIAVSAQPSPSHSQSRPQSQSPSSLSHHFEKTMSITQTYYLAHKARAKLSREAAQPDHDLRLLVGHANLLDTLMVDLADAERERERWFNRSMRNSKAASPSSRHVQWADRVEEEVVDEQEYDSDSSDSDDEFDYDDDVELNNTRSTTTSDSSSSSSITPAASARNVVVENEIMGDDLEEDYAQLELVRTRSHSSSPPELIAHHDSDPSDDDDEDAMSLSSPVDAKFLLEEKSEQEEQESLYDEDYYMGRQSPASLVSAISVY